MEVSTISTNDVIILIITSIISAIVGGSGIVGIVFFFIRRNIENKIKDREAETSKKKEQRIQRMKIDDELQHCQGRLFFWIHKAIVTGQHNGDLEAAFEAYQKAEQAKKDFDRNVLAENEYE